MEVSFSIVDVFTCERFAGNPVAVIHDARALERQQMLNIAREFGFSETTFISPPRDAAHFAQVRIFTPLEEIPFAGHPNIGTVFVMGTQSTAALGALPEMAVLDEWGGDVRVWPIFEGAEVVGAEIQAPQGLERLGDVSFELVARCLGLDASEIAVDRFQPCVASVGLPFAFVELASLEALAAIECDIAAFRQAAERGPQTVDAFAVCAFVVLERCSDFVTVRSRVLSPLGHPPEDPATGSASGALGALLADRAARGTTRFAVTQGVEMGRRSEIEVDVPANGGSVRIRGRCVEVAKGQLRV